MVDNTKSLIIIQSSAALLKWSCIATTCLFMISLWILQSVSIFASLCAAYLFAISCLYETASPGCTLWKIGTIEANPLGASSSFLLDQGCMHLETQLNVCLHMLIESATSIANGTGLC